MSASHLETSDPTSNLPVPLTLFIGREKELEATCALLRQEDVRLVTLTGPGGAGKTRMALQVANRMLPSFADGVYFVALAAINNPPLVIAAIARTLGLMEVGNRPLIEAITSHLRGKQLLFVLDNFEQVLDAAPLVADIMLGVPGLKALVTSRARLRLRGEHEFAVPPLTMPDTHSLPPVDRLIQYEAVRLFVDRAVALRPSFAVTDENAPAVAEICARLDGLPLAIELAAARIKILSAEAMLARLQNRLKLLTGGERDLPERQQTLRRAIEWSYDLLDAQEQSLFRRIAAFSGSRSLEAIEAVCNTTGETTAGPLQPLELDTVEGVSSLVDKNLLQQAAFLGSETRFRMLETIQEYAREKLDESEEGRVLQLRHAEHFLLLAQQAEPELHGPKQVEWLERLKAEHDNFRWALKVAVEQGREETALLMGAALMPFWRMRGHFSEGRNWLEAALASSSIPGPARAKALMALGTLASSQGDYLRASAALEESLALFRQLGDKVSIAASLRNLGNESRMQGNYDTAHAYFKEGLQIARELDAQWEIAAFLGDLGVVTQTLGSLEDSRALYEESLAIRRGLRDKRGIAMMLVNIGELARSRGDYDEAYALYEEGLGLARELGDRWGIGMVLHNLGHVVFHRGRYSQALDLLTESLGIFYELRNKRDIAYCLSAIAGVLGAQGQTEWAATLFSAAQVLSNTISAHLDPADQIEYERNLAVTQAQMSPQAWQAAWDRGQVMTLDEAVSCALLAERPAQPPAKPVYTTRPLDPRTVMTTGPLGATGPLGITGPLDDTGPLGDHPSGLTDREVGVLRLVAQGLTDNDVAERLTISPRTVHRHLSSIYSKLGVTTRTAAVRAAIEHDIL